VKGPAGIAAHALQWDTSQPSRSSRRRHARSRRIVGFTNEGETHTRSPTTTSHAETTVEHGLASALAELRRYGAGEDRDDFHGAAAAEMLDQRPLIVLGVLTEGVTQAWVMRPGDGPDRSVVVGTTIHTARGDLAVDTAAYQKTYTLAEIGRLVDWLVKEDQGLFLSQE
jgi:hypothetical protein